MYQHRPAAVGTPPAGHQKDCVLWWAGNQQRMLQEPPFACRQPLQLLLWEVTQEGARQRLPCPPGLSQTALRFTGKENARCAGLLVMSEAATASACASYVTFSWAPGLCM